MEISAQNISVIVSQVILTTLTHSALLYSACITLNLKLSTYKMNLLLRYHYPYEYEFIVRELSEEEKQMIILSEDFQRFLDRSSRIVERALGESVDIYTDYTGTIDGEDGM